MQIKLQYGLHELLTHYSKQNKVTVEELLQSLQGSHPDIFNRLCGGEGRLRNSMPIFINGEHIRYRNGMATELEEGDHLYIVPFISGG